MQSLRTGRGVKAVPQCFSSQSFISSSLPIRRNTGLITYVNHGSKGQNPFTTRYYQSRSSNRTSRSRPPSSLAVPSPTYFSNRTGSSGEPGRSFEPHSLQTPDYRRLPSSLPSAKLAALHARLSLPSKVPLTSLARALIDQTANADPHTNNSSLAQFGYDLTQYYIAEYILCKYPRLPIPVIDAVHQAYAGAETLNNVVREWGVEAAIEPGPEVDSGLLQFQWAPIGTQVIEPNRTHRGSTTSSTDGAFQKGQPSTGNPSPSHIEGRTPITGAPGVKTLHEAASTFFQAVLATIHLHCGANVAYKFFDNNILSRHLDIGSLFTFTHPLKDLARLCARESLEAPVARIISETGRLSVSPVFVVGVFSGNDMLGEAAGSSLTEARFKACVHALKGWYLYSPAGELLLPSRVEGDLGKHRKYKAAYIDQGEVVV